jgi:hypothetical protein
MSLPACQQRVLDMMESSLQRREPRLASMFAMFTRLNTNEGAPRTERLTPPPWWACRHRTGRHHIGASAAAARALLLIPLAAVVVVAAMFLAMSSSRVPCLPSSGPHGLVASHSHAESCRSGSRLGASGHGP